MAENIIKLKVDSQEYDAKIRRAAEGIQAYAQKCREVGGTLTVVEQETLDYVRALGEMKTASSDAMMSMREMTRAATSLTIQYRELTDEEKNSPFGQALKSSIDQLIQRAGNMKDAMGDVALDIKNMASDTATFDQLAGAANVATSGFQVLQGASKVLGIEMGDNVEIIAKLQAAMAVTNGLSQIQAALQKESAFMQGVNAAKTALATVAQQAYAVVTGEATVAQIAFNVAADANPYGLILGAIGLVVGAIGAFVAVMGDSTEETDKNTEALKRQEHEAEIMKRRHQDMQQSIGNSVGSIEAKYKMLQLQWNSLKSDAEKTQFIKDQKNAFSDLGLKVNSVTQAQEALVNQAPKVIAALKAVAEAEAYSDLYKKSIQKKATEWDNRIKGTNTGDFYKKAHLGDAITDEEAKAAGVRTLSQRKVNATNPNSYNAAGTTKTESLTQEEINKVNVYRAQQAAQMRKQREKEYDDEINIYSRKWEEAQQKALTAQGNISGLLTSETNRLPKTSSTAQKPTGTAPAKTVKVPVEPEFITGPSGFNDETIGAWTSMIKDQLAKADYGTELYNNLTDNLSDMSRLTTTVKDAIALGLDIPQDQVQRMYEEVFDQNNLPEGMYDDMIEKFIEDFKIKTGKDLKIGSDGKLTEGNEGNQSESDNDKEEEKYFTTEFSKLSGGLSGFQSGLKQLGIDLGDGFGSVVSGLQGIASILTAIQTIVGAIDAFSQISAFWPLAGGGIIKAAGGTLVGDSYSGDNLRGIGPGGQIYGLNAGEIVLNRAQAGVLAAELEGGDDGGGVAQPYVSGQYIFLGTNNYLKASGQGEIVTTKMLKRYGLV